MRFAFAPDYENAIDLNRDNKYIVKVRATDSTGNISDQMVSISIEDVDDTNPMIYGPSATISNGSIQVNENYRTIYTFSANEDVSWSIIGGVDKSLFSIDNSTGMLTFYLSPNYEEPTDNDFNNDYVVTVSAVDYELNKSEFTLITYVKDIDEIKSSKSELQENSIDDSSANLISESLTIFEALKYIASNSDLIEGFGIDTASAISHYVIHGKKEGRSLTGFSTSDYLDKYSDLSAAFGDNQISALKHYIQYGYKEGRTDSISISSPILNEFEVLNYIASHRDLINAFGTNVNAANSHYFKNGKAEGRILDDFDEWGYLAGYNDLINAFGINTKDAVKHFISYGKSEGRVISLFDAISYLNNYGDLRNAFGNDQELATKHYVEYGFNEGRIF